MSVDSLLDMIRVNSNNKQDDDNGFPVCYTKGCSEPGKYPAPYSSSKNKTQYVHLCEHHVRLHNKNYNYFRDMSEKEFKNYYDEELVGQRPTWRKEHGFGNTHHAKAKVGQKIKNTDFLNFNWQNFNKEKDEHCVYENENEEMYRKKPLRMRALSVLGLDTKASDEEIKKHYKALVKKYHPDINKNDKLAAENLRKVIDAYRQLNIGSGK